MPIEQLQPILEAAIMVAGRPLSKADMQKLFDETDQPSTQEIQAALQALQQKYQDSGIELREISSGFQFQAKTEFSPWLVKLWEERPRRYSRAFLETLALIAYRQPITRAEIEEIRGVTVSSDIIKTLMEREWIKILGYKEVPGKPALYGTTKTFLDHFNLKSLDQLPTLQEIKDLESQEAKLQVQLELDNIPEKKTLEDTVSENVSENETSSTVSESVPEENFSEESFSEKDFSEEDFSDDELNETETTNHSEENS